MDLLLYNEALLKKDKAINFGRPYQQCMISVMDTIADPNIRFDNNGISNYYYEFQKKEQEQVLKGELGRKQLDEIVTRIKENGKGKQYDCITGVSGGVDSTYVALKAKELGLNPLIVHFDNGWNSELAVKNVENIISKLGFDLHTLVVDWEEFKDIQLAYLKANVVDIEAITDHAIIGTLYRLAAQNNIKYILSGSNIVTEATLPSYWIWNKTDHTNIRDIHKRFGKLPIKTFPFFSTKEKQYYMRVKKIETICPLNYMDYNKKAVKDEISTKLGWKDYGGKHYESVWTRFYQGYILPSKFGIDKRKAHFSDLIFSGQITKEAALEELNQPNYNLEQLIIDYEFVLKKFQISKLEFDSYIKENRKEHSDYAVEKGLSDRFFFLKIIKKLLTSFIRVSD